jgi:hypothetical protein
MRGIGRQCKQMFSYWQLLLFPCAVRAIHVVAKYPFWIFEGRC